MAKLGVEESANVGKLMQNEQDEEVIVTKETYAKLIGGAGGVPLVIIVIINMAIFIAC